MDRDPTPDAAARHTPEPWHVRPFVDPSYCIPNVHSSDGTCVCDLYGGGYVNRDVCNATADRIVACVNALAGIPDPAQHLAAQSSRIAALEEALRFYADRENYDEPGCGTDIDSASVVQNDNGDLARMALKSALASPARAEGGKALRWSGTGCTWHLHDCKCGFCMETAVQSG